MTHNGRSLVTLATHRLVTLETSLERYVVEEGVDR